MLRYCVVITRPEGRPPIVLGPFQNQARADARASRLNERLGRRLELDRCSASVEPIEPGATAIRDVLDWLR